MSNDAFSCRMAVLTEHDIAWASFHGVLTVEALGRAYARYKQLPGNGPTCDEIVDFRAADFTGIRTEDLVRIRTALAGGDGLNHGRSAMIVSGPLAYGLGRQIGSMTEYDLPVQRAIFETLAEALDWLRPGAASALLDAWEAADAVVHA